MNKLSKFAYVAAAVLVTSSASAQSTLAEYQPTNVDWSNRNGESVWTNGTNEIFWQDSLSKTDNKNR